MGIFSGAGMRFHARKGAPGDVLSPTVGVAVFRVLGGQIRFDGFPFGWSRNPPKRAVLEPYRMAHRIDRRGAHARVSCAWKSRVPTRSAFGSWAQVPHNPQLASKALVSSFLTREFT